MVRLLFLSSIFLAIFLPIVLADDVASTGNSVPWPPEPQPTVEVPTGVSTGACLQGPCTARSPNVDVEVSLDNGGTATGTPGGIEAPEVIEANSPSAKITEGSAGVRVSTQRSSAGRAQEVTHTGTKKQTKATNAQDYRQEGDKVEIAKADRVEVGGIKADKIVGFRLDDDGTITIVEAERIELPNGILAQVSSFVGSELEFHVGEARDVVLGCITMRQVRDSDFLVSGNEIEIRPAKDVEFHIADCGFSQNNFKAYSSDSKLTISKARRANYEIEKSELKCHSAGTSKTVCLAA